MRYYEISLTPPGGSTATTVWSSHPKGVFDPSAQNVMFDMPVLPYDTPAGGQTISIEGVSLQQIGQAMNAVGSTVTVKGGMQKGLPLANPAQAGVLVVGQVFQAFGNWEGTEMSFDMVILPSSFTSANPGNLVLNWRAGQTLADALTNTFNTAYPGVPVSMNIGSNLVLSNDEPHPATTLEELSAYVSDLTDSHFQQKVSITIQGGKIVVFDSTYQPSPIQLQFTDMIGQPTWIDAKTMQVKCVMRSDIQVGAKILMPQGIQNAAANGATNFAGLVSTQAASLPSQMKYQSSFQNTFQVSELRHVGNYRAGDASGWCTIFNCIATA